jgi:uracil-DNA glycosylase
MLSFEMDKKAELERIAKEIENCRECRKDKIGKAVPGEGSPDAKAVFIGEAPGKQESLTGRPFIGRSGKLLRDMISRIGIDEKNVYITSPVKYLPKYGTPKPSDIVHGKLHFDRQMQVINPKLFVLMGSVACIAVLGETLPITQVHGKTIERDGRKHFIMYHPAAVLRFPGKFRENYIKDFRELKAEIDRL